MFPQSTKNRTSGYARRGLKLLILVAALAIPGFACGQERHPVTLRLEKLAGQLAESKKSDAELVEAIYLASLSRFPTDVEKQRTVDFFGRAKTRAAGLDDLVWAITNVKEYHELHGIKIEMDE